jgi:lipopolysaccharide transport protein LptA
MRKIDLYTGPWIIVAIAVLTFCLSALAEKEATRTVFYDYSADNMNSDRKTGVTILEGDAKLKVRDSEDYLNADKVTIYRDVESDELIKMEAVGNVDMNQKGMKATCHRAIFYETEDRIELEGTEDSLAVVDDGKNKMEAPNITYFRKEDRIEAKGKVSGHVMIKEKPGETVEKE